MLLLPVPPARGGRGGPGFELTDDHAEAVAEICRRLDGLALAIGPAATRVRLPRPQKQLLRLGQRLSVFTAGERDLLDRQRTLPNSRGWSSSLLCADAQALFARLGVFPGPFTPFAVEAVGSAVPHLPSLRTEQRQLGSNSICARAGFAVALMWRCSARENPGGEP